MRLPPWKLILHVETGEEEAYRLDLDPRERDSRPGEAPPELREPVFRELESAERLGLTEEEETVTKGRSDVGAAEPPQSSSPEVRGEVPEGVAVLDSVREFCRKRGIRFEPGPWRYRGGLV